MTSEKCSHQFTYHSTDNPLHAYRTCTLCDIEEIVEYQIPQGMIVCPTCKGSGKQLRLVQHEKKGWMPADVVCPQCAGGRWLSETWKEVMDEGQAFRQARVNSGKDILTIAMELGVDVKELSDWEQGKRSKPW